MKKRITIVCTGNVCRSPMAEHLLRHALAAEPEPQRSIVVESAGTAASAGLPATDHAVRALAKVGLALGSHRSKPLSRDLLDASDLILVMTEAHRAAVRRLAPELRAPVLLFREPMGGAQQEVPDPYGGGLEFYLETRDALAEAIPAILQYLRHTHDHENQHRS